jgi:hypothetical protein
MGWAGRAQCFTAMLAVCLAVLAGGCQSEPEEFDALKRHPRVNDPERPMCGQPTTPRDDSEPTDPTPIVPYPTPAGEVITPAIRGIPLPPGAAQIDSFRNDRTTVQVFETDISAKELFNFYDDVMRKHGWFVGRVTRGVSCEYVSELVEFKSTPEYRIEVTTSFVPRAGEETGDGTPAPGFRGEGFGFEPRSATKTVFSIVTPHK